MRRASLGLSPPKGRLERFDESIEPAAVLACLCSFIHGFLTPCRSGFQGVRKTLNVRYDRCVDHRQALLVLRRLHVGMELSHCDRQGSEGCTGCGGAESWLSSVRVYSVYLLRACIKLLLPDHRGKATFLLLTLSKSTYTIGPGLGLTEVLPILTANLPHRKRVCCIAADTHSAIHPVLLSF